jgi:hypothetical protein
VVEWRITCGNVLGSETTIVAIRSIAALLTQRKIEEADKTVSIAPNSCLKWMNCCRLPSTLSGWRNCGLIPSPWVATSVSKISELNKLRGRNHSAHNCPGVTHLA